MKTESFMCHVLVRASSLIILGTTLTACAGPSFNTRGWKEEVKLHDGRVIVVERVFTVGGRPTLDAQEQSRLDQTITFLPPGSSVPIQWSTNLRNDVPNPMGLGPLLIDVVASMPYLVTSPAGCVSYNNMGRPNPPYIVFKYEAGAWQRIPLHQLPIELSNANLMPVPASSRLKPYYNLEDANAERRSGNIQAYAQRISREIVTGKDAITNCPDFNSPQYRSFKAPP